MKKLISTKLAGGIMLVILSLMAVLHIWDCHSPKSFSASSGPNHWLSFYPNT